ncbi:MAG: multiheme c-type cytochrome [Acidobacteriota bacterium]
MSKQSQLYRIKLACIAFSVWVTIVISFSTGPSVASSIEDQQKEKKTDGKRKTQKEDPKSTGCLSCHEGSESMHQQSGTDFELGIGCVDCHGGNPEPAISPSDSLGSSTYNEVKKRAHVHPRHPEAWDKVKEPFSTRNPERTNALLVRESPEFVRFINPGDFRAAMISCGTANCHPQEVYFNRKSLMTHGAMLWGAALYNNGSYPLKDPHFGESYSVDGRPQRIQTMPIPSEEEVKKKGVLPYINPLPRYEMAQAAATNVLRVFERGGISKPGVLLPSDIGSPDPDEDPGRLDINGGRLSSRGYGTATRTDPVFQGLQKTRLLDPLLHFLGTNDQPGDFRSSGCTGCHVVYANDRDPIHSAHFAKYGNLGKTETADPTIKKEESGHPIKHEMTNGIPSSQCMVCHMHPGTSMVLGYFGYTWWDNETDGEHMYAKEPNKLSEVEKEIIRIRNPEGSAVKGLWGQDANFLAEIWKEVNPKLKHSQFADFHGHGWVFRAVYKQDKKGNFLDENDKIVDFNDPEKWKKMVQMRDIHLDKGMHCADCHFRNDSHGNGNLYGSPRDAIELDCVDCHGTIYQKANLITSGPAAGQGRFNGKVINKNGFNIANIRTPFGKKLFEVDKKTDDIYQNSMVTKGLRWKVVQTINTITPGHADYDEQSRLAKTMRRDGKTWGDLPDPKTEETELAHANSRMTCYTCHTSWTTSCFGCHLEMRANKQRPLLHFEDKNLAKDQSREMFRNWTSYNYQVLRNDIFFLGIDGTVTGHRIAPARSACAIYVSSQNALRDWIYTTHQTISAEGFSGQAFSTFVPHTVRKEETKRCTECHVSAQNDNNAWIAQVLMQGTNLLSFMSRYIHVAVGHHGFESIAVAERDEPQAIIGSKLHELAYPENFKTLKRQGEGFKDPKTDRYEHRANGSSINSLQLRGEYLYTANGTGGFRIYDMAQLDNKEFSERIVTAPVSPIGQRFYVKSKNATAIAAPTTMAVDPTRKHFPQNEEGSIHIMYAFLYGTDKEEGFIVIGPVGTLLDGEARNNFIKRAVTFNPDNKLKGATNLTIVGTYAYVSTNHGLYVIDINDPTNPKITAEIGEPFLKHPHSVAIQFRYAFVTDEEGLKVLDVTSLDQPKPVDGALVPLADAHNVYVARTNAFVAAGKEGLVIVDITIPTKPKMDQVFNAGGEINDAHDVKIGMVANSAFAFVADGHNGLRVVQIIGPDENNDVYGWSSHPKPKLIATYHTEGEALTISEGVDRDRAVDESGNQLAVFGRRGARPFNKAEIEKMYLRNGQVYTVTDEPPGPPREFNPIKKAAIFTDYVVPITVPSHVNQNSNVPLISFALVFLPMAILLSHRRKQK